MNFGYHDRTVVSARDRGTYLAAAIEFARAAGAVILPHFRNNPAVDEQAHPTDLRSGDGRRQGGRGGDPRRHRSPLPECTASSARNSAISPARASRG